jgi:hypothetical protein
MDWPMRFKWRQKKQLGLTAEVYDNNDDDGAYLSRLSRMATAIVDLGDKANT